MSTEFKYLYCVIAINNVFTPNKKRHFSGKKNDVGLTNSHVYNATFLRQYKLDQVQGIPKLLLRSQPYARHFQWLFKLFDFL